ncbi:MAG: RNA-binding protein S1 [Selenomonadaceae bacterium]|nr:RNA-binding protein S1 [Selenomonadaceae bacterium]
MAMEAGSIVEGKVTRITNFGAFVELEEGKVGLIHISEVADVYVNDVRDFLSEGDKVQVKIVSIDGNKIALSIKQAKPKPPETESSKQRRGDFRKPQRQLSASFEDKLSKFLKDSDERLTDLKRKTDSKRGGRGSRRSD